MTGSGSEEERRSERSSDSEVKNRVKQEQEGDLGDQMPEMVSDVLAKLGVLQMLLQKFKSPKIRKDFLSEKIMKVKCCEKVLHEIDEMYEIFLPAFASSGKERRSKVKDM